MTTTVHIISRRLTGGVLLLINAIKRLLLVMIMPQEVCMPKLVLVSLSTPLLMQTESGLDTTLLLLNRLLFKPTRIFELFFMPRYLRSLFRLCSQ